MFLTVSRVQISRTKDLEDLAVELELFIEEVEQLIGAKEGQG